MSRISKAEDRFIALEGEGKILVSQPAIKHHGVTKWTPDFIDANTGIYYEIIGTRQSYYKHKACNHFDFMLKHNLSLMIAVYIKPVYGGKNGVIPDRFIIKQYVPGMILSYNDDSSDLSSVYKEGKFYFTKGGIRMGKIQAFVDDRVLKEVKKDAIDENVSVGNYITEALVERLERRKAEANKETVNQTNKT
jgi:hypothetical protein